MTTSDSLLDSSGGIEGESDGISDGKSDGESLGSNDGLLDGMSEGISDGESLGTSDGTIDGTSDGLSEASLGIWYGESLGCGPLYARTELFVAFAQPVSFEWNVVLLVLASSISSIIVFS